MKDPLIPSLDTPELRLLALYALLRTTGTSLTVPIKSDILANQIALARTELSLELIEAFVRFLNEIEAKDLSYQDRYHAICRAIGELGQETLTSRKKIAGHQQTMLETFLPHHFNPTKGQR